MPPILFVAVVVVLVYLFVRICKNDQQINPDPPMPNVGIGRIILAILVGIVLVAILIAALAVLSPEFGYT